MTEYTLNKLDIVQLVEFARSSGTFLTAFITPAFKIELYHTGEHFVEISYSLRKTAGQPANWKLYSANHYPDVPESTKYLQMFLDQIDLPVD